jgi:hypothetical protein
MAGTGETRNTSSSGPRGWVGTVRSYNEEGTEIETTVIGIFLTLDQVNQWARKMAEIAGDTDIEAKLPRLSQKPYPDRISIGADPAPAEEGREEDGGRSQFEVIPGIQVFGTLAGGNRRKTLRRRRRTLRHNALHRNVR